MGFFNDWGFGKELLHEKNQICRGCPPTNFNLNHRNTHHPQSYFSSTCTWRCTLPTHVQVLTPTPYRMGHGLGTGTGKCQGLGGGEERCGEGEGDTPQPTKKYQTIPNQNNSELKQIREQVHQHTTHIKVLLKIPNKYNTLTPSLEPPNIVRH